MALDQHSIKEKKLERVIALEDLIWTPPALSATGILELLGFVIGTLRNFF
ncbi:uncharacterized protein METZ01_LOCUS178729, partial [marine metagenome]